MKLVAKPGQLDRLNLAATPFAGTRANPPYLVQARQVYVAGAAIAQVYVAGSRAGQVVAG